MIHVATQLFTLPPPAECMRNAALQIQIYLPRALQDHRHDGGQQSGLRQQSFTFVLEMGGSYTLQPGGTLPKDVGIVLLEGEDQVTSQSTPLLEGKLHAYSHVDIFIAYFLHSAATFPFVQLVLQARHPISH